MGQGTRRTGMAKPLISYIGSRIIVSKKKCQIIFR